MALLAPVMAFFILMGQICPEPVGDMPVGTLLGQLKPGNNRSIGGIGWKDYIFQISSVGRPQRKG